MLVTSSMTAGGADDTDHYGGPCSMQFGALCWRMHRRQVEVLLITSRDTGRWVIPKGWAVDGLSPALSAAREAWEEAGVEGVVSDTGLGRFRYDKVVRPSQFIPCEVQVFGLRVARLAERFPEHKQRRRKWFNAETAARKVNEPQLRELLAALPQGLDPVASKMTLVQV